MTSNVKKASIGDLAADGLLAGLPAGLIMAIYILASGLLMKNNLTDILSRFSPGEPVSPVTGALTHLAISAIYGLLFGVVGPFFSRYIPLKVSGLLYGLFLFLVAWFAILPELNSSSSAISALHLAIAHLIYGAALGWQISKNK